MYSEREWDTKHATNKLSPSRLNYLQMFAVKLIDIASPAVPRGHQHLFPTTRRDVRRSEKDFNDLPSVPDSSLSAAVTWRSDRSGGDDRVVGKILLPDVPVRPADVSTVSSGVFSTVDART
ncbi:PREDICTED: uncharacterized protein LOC105562500 [Vollenhovia emeryi]|uniref:uncharacterized protein LOC105562500 n=1 Tax=Vollenhovia emeryi TaxID=411798 RepID=UPI0005F3641E|nr:PREDICTED: uncharacterized protein LOC105562500 [Vollenhovia emeryi]